jgi:hypothetical protein
MRCLTCALLLITGLSATCAGTTMPAISSQLTRQELLNQIDKLSGSSREVSPAVRALEAADASVVVPMLIDRLKRNIEYTQNNKRLSVPGTAMPPPRVSLKGKKIVTTAKLKPAQTLTIIWEGIVRDMPPFKDWATEYHNVRVRYAPGKAPAIGTNWGGDSVISNSVVRAASAQ